MKEETILRYLGGPNAITRVLMREEGKRRVGAREGDVVGERMEDQRVEDPIWLALRKGGGYEQGMQEASCKHWKRPGKRLSLEPPEGAQHC